MTNLQVAEAFANHKSGASRHLYTNGRVIYSYGRHFPVAVWLADGSVAFNKSSYSVTTSTHKSIVRRCLSHVNVISVSHDVMLRLADQLSLPALVTVLPEPENISLDSFLDLMRKWAKTRGIRKLSKAFRRYMDEIRSYEAEKNL